MSEPQLQLRNALCADLGQLRGLLDSYLEELAQHRPARVGASASDEYPYLDAYFTEASRIPYLLELGLRTVGFAFVRSPESTQTGRFSLAELYVDPAHRRRGLGRRAVEALFRAHPGAWELQVLESNPPARAFWDQLRSSPSVRSWEEHRISASDGPRSELWLQVGPS
jgi:predicted acetyltransferase